jgi:hypothetical protein
MTAISIAAVVVTLVTVVAVVAGSQQQFPSSSSLYRVLPW